MMFMTGSLLLFGHDGHGIWRPGSFAFSTKVTFYPHAHILQLLAPVLFFMGLNHAQMQMLIALNKERKLLLGAFFVCAVNLLAAWILVPRYGMAGTCYALIGSEIAYCVFLQQAMRAGD